MPVQEPVPASEQSASASESQSESESDGDSFIVSDSEDLLTAAQHAEVDAELERIREARADIAELAVGYLRGMPQPRVHARVMAKAWVASGASCASCNNAWQPWFVELLLKHSRLTFHDAPGGGAYGLCAACNRPGLLSNTIASPETGAVRVGWTCGLRALAMHTLHHARATCAAMLDATPLPRLAVTEKSAVQALLAVLEAAADAGEQRADGDTRLWNTVHTARAALGFA